MRRTRLQRTQSGGDSKGLLSLAVALIACTLSLGGTIRVYGMPAEARTQEVWYAYNERLLYDFSATVTPGSIYPSRYQRSEELLRVRLPIDPPAYRRALVTSQTESLTLTFPYHFEADRSASIRARYRVDGTLTIPNLWQRPLPLVPQTEVSVIGTRLDLTEIQVEIPIRQIIEQMAQLTEELRVTHEQAEIRVSPVIEVMVEGLREPIQTGFSPEIVILIRGTNYAVEVDDVRILRDERAFTTTVITPVTVTLWGWPVRVATLRLVILSASGLFALTLLASLLRRRRRPPAMAEAERRRLGGSVVTARSFELPAGVAMVELTGVQQLLAVHSQTERPVVQVGDFCYLLDGGTCYRLMLPASQGATR